MKPNILELELFLSKSKLADCVEIKSSDLSGISDRDLVTLQKKLIELSWRLGLEIHKRKKSE